MIYNAPIAYNTSKTYNADLIIVVIGLIPLAFAAFDSPVHVAFGCLADGISTKGHTSISGDVI
jgi:hypothetical protein